MASARIKFSEIANRLTGFSTPIFGLQWTPAKLDQDVAREVIVFLEDKRSLYSPYEAETPDGSSSPSFRSGRC